MEQDENNSTLQNLEEEEEEEEEYEDEEPILKYHRLGHGVSELFQKEAASCLTVHSRFLVKLLKFLYY